MNPEPANQEIRPRLRKFAATHHLRVRAFAIDGEDPGAAKGSVICFGVRAAVSELADVPRLLGVSDTWSAESGWLGEFDGQQGLCFSIWPPHADYLCRAIRFDCYQYDPFNRRTTAGPEPTTWGDVLGSLRIRYLTESENGIAFTFPAEDQTAARTVLALAATRVALEDLGQISEAVFPTSGLPFSVLMARAAVDLRSANRSKTGYQRLRV
jgi:hypothetical protein